MDGVPVVFDFLGDEASWLDDGFAGEPLSADLYSFAEPRDSVCHSRFPCFCLQQLILGKRVDYVSVGQTVAKYFVKPVDCEAGGEGGIRIRAETYIQQDAEQQTAVLAILVHARQ